MQDIGERKVGEGDPYSTRQTDASTPAGRQFQLVARFLLDRPVDIHRAIARVRDNTGLDLFLVEKAEIGNLPGRSDNITTTELIAGYREQLPADHIFFRFVVAGDGD